jgi:hypothetical protein
LDDCDTIFFHQTALNPRKAQHHFEVWQIALEVFKTNFINELGGFCVADPIATLVKRGAFLRLCRAMR